MRCLFLPDELAVFRPVARAIQELKLQFVILLNFDLLTVVMTRLHFDLIVAGVSSPDSEVLRTRRRLSLAKTPVLGVTPDPKLVEPLRAAGASRVVLLSDGAEHLVTAMRELLKKSAH
jgi:hypothetical protein